MRSLIETRITIIMPDASDYELRQATSQLIKDILSIDEVEHADFISSVAMSDGAKGDAVSWQDILVTFAASGGVVTTFISVLNTWINRHDKSSVKVTVGKSDIEITGMPSADAQATLRVFLEGSQKIQTDGSDGIKDASQE